MLSRGTFHNYLYPVCPKQMKQNAKLLTSEGKRRKSRGSEPTLVWDIVRYITRLDHTQERDQTSDQISWYFFCRFFFSFSPDNLSRRFVIRTDRWVFICGICIDKPNDNNSYCRQVSISGAQDDGYSQ